MLPERSAERDKIILWQDKGAELAALLLKTTNEDIRNNPLLKGTKNSPSLEGMLNELGNLLNSQEVDLNAVVRMLGGWSTLASSGDLKSINALVITGGFMYDGWRDVGADDETRGFVAAKACHILLSLDNPKSGKSISSYGREAFSDIIFPIVSYGNTLGRDGSVLLLNAAQRDSYPSHPYHVINRHVGFREKITFMKDNITDALGRVARHIPGFKSRE